MIEKFTRLVGGVSFTRQKGPMKTQVSRLKEHPQSTGRRYLQTKSINDLGESRMGLNPETPPTIIKDVAEVEGDDTGVAVKELYMQEGP